MARSAAGRRTARTSRAARRGPWTVILASLTAMGLTFIGLTAIELTTHASTTSKVIVVADEDAVTGTQRITLTREQVASGPVPSITVRLRNTSKAPVSIAAVLEGGSAQVGGTLTAALTVEGAVVRSAPLNVLKLPRLLLDPGATTPLKLDLDLAPADIDQVWSGGELVLVLTTTEV